MYVFYCNNPANNLRAGDCVIRAICKVTGNTWEKVYTELSVEGYSLADWGNANHVWDTYLGVKNQLAQAQRDNVGLQNAVNMATMQANSLATADNIVDNLYNRLKNCPVNTTPVYGNQPIFTCPQNLNSGCGCGSF